MILYVSRAVKQGIPRVSQHAGDTHLENVSHSASSQRATPDMHGHYIRAGAGQIIDAAAVEAAAGRGVQWKLQDA